MPLLIQELHGASLICSIIRCRRRRAVAAVRRIGTLRSLVRRPFRAFGLPRSPCTRNRGSGGHLFARTCCGSRRHCFRYHVRKHLGLRACDHDVLKPPMQLARNDQAQVAPSWHHGAARGRGRDAPGELLTHRLRRSLLRCHVPARTSRAAQLSASESRRGCQRSSRQASGRDDAPNAATTLACRPIRPIETFPALALVVPYDGPTSSHKESNDSIDIDQGADRHHRGRPFTPARRCLYAFLKTHNFTGTYRSLFRRCTHFRDAVQQLALAWSIYRRTHPLPGLSRTGLVRRLLEALAIKKRNVPRRRT